MALGGLLPSWPGLSRPSTPRRHKDWSHIGVASCSSIVAPFPAFDAPNRVDGGDKPGHDALGPSEGLYLGCSPRHKGVGRDRNQYGEQTRLGLRTLVAKDRRVVQWPRCHGGQAQRRICLAFPCRYRRLVLCREGKSHAQAEDGDVLLGPGDLYVVPKGVEHCPVAAEEVHLLLIEQAGTPNTGDPATAAVKTRI